MLWDKLKQNWIAIACAATILMFIGSWMLDNQNENIPQPVTTQIQQQYVGSVKSDKFHYPGCRWAQNIHGENEVWFSSREEAINCGYVPCQTCRP